MMGKLPKREAGFSIVELLLMLVIVVLVGAVGWYVYTHRHKTAVVSVAITKPATSATKTSTTTHTQPITNYFTIKEWGVKAPYSGTDTLTYSIAADNPNLAWVGSGQLASADQNCKIAPNSGGNAGSVGRYLPGDNIALEGSLAETAQAYLSQDFKASNSQPPAYSKVGKYYYIYWTGEAACSSTASSDVIYNQTMRVFEDLVEKFQAVTL